MNWRNNAQRYGALSIGFHWLMLVLIAAVYASMELHDIFPRGSAERGAMMTWHYMLGLSVLVLAAARLVVRASGPTPRIEPDPVAWQQLLAKLMHLALYALMLGLPVAGWLTLSAQGKPIPFFGWQLPALLAENKNLAKSIKEVHETVASAGYFLIGLHAAAALYHHYVVRDNTLQRMLPGRKRTLTFR